MIALYLLVIVPLFVVTPGLFMNQSGTPKMLSIAAGLYLLLKSGGRLKAAAAAEVTAFMAVCLVSWLFAANHWMGFAGCPGAPYYGLFPLSMVALAYFGSTTVTDDILPALAWSGAILGAFAVAQDLAGQSFTGMALQGGRAMGFRGSPVMFGSSLVVCFLASWHLGRWDTRYSWAHVTLTPLIFAGMIAASAKGAIFASIAGICAYESSGKDRWFFLMCWLSLLWSCLFIAPFKNNAERHELLNMAWMGFKQRPLLGWGPDNFLVIMGRFRTAAYTQLVGTTTSQGSAHQDLAQVAATLGLAGLGAYLWMVWGLVKSSLEDPLSLAIIVAMVFQAQVNPIPTDVLVAAAIIVGSRTVEYGWWDCPEWLSTAVLCGAVSLSAMDLAPAARMVLR